MVVIFRKFHFELHVEKEPLLVNLDLPEAIAGFLHLAFVFNLKFPKVFRPFHGISNLISYFPGVPNPD
jgi:hypothetical protein